MGAIVKIEGGHVEVTSQKLHPTTITLGFPSVGATENLIMASIFTEGETIIKNAGLEPEIGDLINFLNRMGAKIRGAETTIITVSGVKKLHGCEYEAIGDRIEAGTYIMAALATRGNVKVCGFNPKHLEFVIEN